MRMPLPPNFIGAPQAQQQPAPAAARLPQGYPQPLELAQLQLAQFGRLGAQRVYQFPEVAALNPGAISAQQTVRFRVSGIVTGFYGSTLAGTQLQLAEISVKVLIGGSEALFTDGSADVFVPLAALVGGAQNWFPLNRRVYDGQSWTIQYLNRSGASVITPFAQLAVVEAP